MGMSASQARLLSLTSRLSDLELKAQQISNSKIRLSSESSAASKAYTEALDKQKITVMSGVDANGKTYANASAYNLTTYGALPDTVYKQRFIKNASGQVIVSNQIKNAYENNRGWTNYSLDQYKTMSLDQMEHDDRFINFVYNAEGRPDLNGDTQRDWDDYVILISQSSDKMKYYQQLFLEIMESGGCVAQSDDNLKSPEWLEAQVSAGNVFLYVPEKQDDGKTDYVNSSWTSGDYSIQEKNDDTDTARAEAEYETTMADIQSKDKRFDLELKNIDTEHSAVTTEIDSVKNVIKKNIEKSFKMFDA